MYSLPRGLQQEGDKGKDLLGVSFVIGEGVALTWVRMSHILDYLTILHITLLGLYNYLQIVEMGIFELLNLF